MTQKTRAASGTACVALIVDDSSVMRKIVERTLRQAGTDLKQVLDGGGGAEALTGSQDMSSTSFSAISTCG